MAKKRKTREQKKLADLRHKFIHVPAALVATSFFDSKQTTSGKIEAKTITVSQNNYPYLKKDLSKTTLLTIGILIFQALLFIILKNHIIVFPALNY